MYLYFKKTYLEWSLTKDSLQNKSLYSFYKELEVFKCIHIFCAPHISQTFLELVCAQVTRLDQWFVRRSDWYVSLLNQDSRQQAFISKVLEAWESQIKVPVNLVSGETCLTGLQMTIFWLCCSMVERARTSSPVSPFRCTNPIMRASPS